MDSKEIRGLMEAYSEVYAPQKVDEATAMAKRGHDETAIRQKIAQSTGGGKSADRATALADKQVFKGSGSARDNLARKQRTDFRNTTSSNPGLQVGQHKATTPEDKAKQAARAKQRAVLTPAEKQRLNMEMEYDVFDVVLEFLQAEGYAETLEEAEWIMANELTSEDIEEILEAYKEPNLQKMRRQEDRHTSKAVKQSGGSRGSSKNRANKMSSIRGALERGEDPRADGYGGARAARGNPPEDHRAAYSKNPLNNPPRKVKKPGV